MDKTAIKNFAIWARNALIRNTKDKCGLVGIQEDGIQDPLPQSTADIQFFDAGTGTPSSITGIQISQRDALVKKIREKERDSDYQTAYNYVVEQVAYTWFNRLIAIRFMEVNDYLPARIRVLSSKQAGKLEPDIVTTPFDADFDFRMEEEEQIRALKDRGQREDMDVLFRILFIKQCGALHELLPGLFQKIDDHDYTQLLLSISFTDREGVVYHLIHDIDESAFDISHKDEDGKTPGQVEIIGWLYQYYNTEPKAKVFGRPSGTKIKKEDIPAATQLFTPDWIVRYMVENSLGRMWIEGHPNDGLKESWRYYLDEVEQEPEVHAKLEELHREYAGLNPEDITCIDPCMGSGHILCAFFDVLMQIYESQGYTPRDAAQRILEYNIWGMDIDERAYQLSYFAVLMKARQYDRQILKRGIHPHVYAVKESDGLNRTQLKYFGASLDDFTRNNALNQVNSLLDQMTDAKEYGSLLSVDAMDFDLMREFVEHINLEDQMDMDAMGVDDTQRKLQELIRVGETLAKKYDVVCTNPPYMPVSNGDAALNKFIKDNYPDSKGDLFAVFIERCGQMAKRNGYQAMITQHSWMFLSSFEKLRTKLLLTADLVNMAHLGARAFEEIGGEVVQTTSFVIRKSHVASYLGAYCRLIGPTTQQGKEDMFLAGENRYAADQSNFSKIPGSPVAYWASAKILESYENGKLIGDTADVKIGMGTGKNEIFVREWWEVFYSKIDFSLKSVDDLETSPGRYFPYNKGGEFRLWFGNLQEVLWFDVEGRRYMDTMSGHRENGAHDFYCKEGLTWSFISSSKFGIRYLPTGCFFDVAGSTLFSRNDNLFTLGFLASCVCFEILKILNPTLNYQAGNIKSLPLLIDRKQEVNSIVEQNILKSKQDWDSYETSWDFKRHPLV